MADSTGRMLLSPGSIVRARLTTAGSTPLIRFWHSTPGATCTPRSCRIVSSTIPTGTRSGESSRTTPSSSSSLQTAATPGPLETRALRWRPTARADWGLPLISSGYLLTRIRVARSPTTSMWGGHSSPVEATKCGSRGPATKEHTSQPRSRSPGPTTMDPSTSS